MSRIPVKHRAEELAEALATDPWIPERVRARCRDLLKKWAKEDTTVDLGGHPEDGFGPAHD